MFFDLASLSRGLSSYVELTDLDFGPARPKDGLVSALHPVLALRVGVTNLNQLFNVGINSDPYV